MLKPLKRFKLQELKFEKEKKKQRRKEKEMKKQKTVCYVGSSTRVIKRETNKVDFLIIWIGIGGAVPLKSDLTTMAIEGAFI